MIFFTMNPNSKIKMWEAGGGPTVSDFFTMNPNLKKKMREAGGVQKKVIFLL